MALVNAGEAWQCAVLIEARRWCADQKRRGIKVVTIEEFRAACCAQPHSPKAWGSVPGMLQRAGLIAPEVSADGHQVFRRAAAPKTHGHPVRAWRLV